MPAKLKLELSEAQVLELEELRDHAAKPYLRERAAAILKIVEGSSGREVALHGLLKPHWQDTIYEWVQRYRAEGKAGLEIKSGRGRKPSFSPSVCKPRGS
jgi:transposase